MGRIVWADGIGLFSERLDDGAYLADLLASSAREAGATVMHVHTEQFAPQGVTAFCVLAESHVSIHTYPEHHAAMVDVFTCGADVSPEQIMERITDALVGGWSVTSRARGGQA